MALLEYPILALMMTIDGGPNLPANVSKLVFTVTTKWIGMVRKNWDTFIRTIVP